MDRDGGAFDIVDVNANSARFDPRKCEVINATHIRMLTPAEFAANAPAYLPEASPQVIAVAAPLVQERVQTPRRGAADMLRFLVEDEIEMDDDARAKQLGDAGQGVLARRRRRSDPAGTGHRSIETALRQALVDDLGLKPRTHSARSALRSPGGQSRRAVRVARAARTRSARWLASKAARA